MLIFSADALLTHVFPEELYLVAPVMPQGGHVMLHGKRTTGKTQLALTLAHDVIAGLPFLGVLDTRKGKVAYIQADMPPRVQQDRLQKLNAAIGVIYDDRMRYYLADTQLDVTNHKTLQTNWSQDIHDYAPALVIVDTLRKSHRLDENSSDTPVAVYAAWREAVGPKPTILYLHHDRKTSFDFAPSDRDEEFRGSGAWLDEADLGMHIMKAKGDARLLEWSKARTFDPEDVGAFTLNFDKDSLLLIASDPIDAYLRDAVKRGLPKAQILACLQDAARWGKRTLSQASAYRRYDAAATPG